MKGAGFLAHPSAVFGRGRKHSCGTARDLHPLPPASFAWKDPFPVGCPKTGPWPPAGQVSLNAGQASATEGSVGHRIRVWRPFCRLSSTEYARVRLRAQLLRYRDRQRAAFQARQPENFIDNDVVREYTVVTNKKDPG